jgi:hypothetical protein
MEKTLHVYGYRYRYGYGYGDTSDQSASCIGCEQLVHVPLLSLYNVLAWHAMQVMEKQNCISAQGIRIELTLVSRTSSQALVRTLQDTKLQKTADACSVLV